MLDRVLAIVPNDTETQAARAWMEFSWHADTKPLHELIASLQATNPALLPTIGDGWLTCGLAERDADAATMPWRRLAKTNLTSARTMSL